MTTRIRKLLCAPIVAVFAFANAASAADNTWTNAATTFLWNFTDANWTAPTVWANGDSAIFGPTGVGTIQLAPGIQANSLNFTATGYTLVGGDLTLFPGFGAVPSFTIQVGPLTGAGTFAATINSALATTGGLNKLGIGTLTLTNASNVLNVGTFPIATSGLSANILIGSATDPTVLGGTLALANAAALTAGTSVAVGNGALNVEANNVTLGALTLANTTTVATLPTAGVFATGGGSISIADNIINLIGNTAGRGHTIGANIVMPATLDLRVGNSTFASSDLFLTGVLSGAGGLMLSAGVSDTGTPSFGGIALRASNTFTGGFTLNSPSGPGVLVDVNSIGPANAPVSGAFGTGLVTIATTGTLASPANARTIANPVSVQSDFSIAGTGGLIFTGAIDLNATGVPVTRALTLTGPATFNGVVQNSSGAATLHKLGTGILTLNAANTYSGGTRLEAGSLALGNDQALSSATLTVTGNSSLIATGGPRTIANPVVFDQATAVVLTFGVSGPPQPLSLTGPIDLNASGVPRDITFVAGTGTSTAISGSITHSNGSAGLTKSGTGTINLSGANNYDGTTTVLQGTLALTGSNAGTGPTTVALAGTVQFLGDGSFASGAIGVGGTLQPLTSGTFTRSVANNGPGGMTVLVGTGLTPTFAGAITPGTGVSVPFTKSGPGSLTLTNPSTTGVGGTATVTGGGALILAGTSGNLSTASAYSVTTGSRLVADNSVQPNNRLNDLAGVTLNAGEFRVLGNAVGTISESVGALNVANGLNTVSGDLNGGTGLTLNFAGYTQPASASATVLFRGQNLGLPGGVHVNFTAGAPADGTLLARALGDNDPNGTGNFLVEYSTLNGVQQVTYTPGLVIQNLAPTLTPTTAHFQVTGPAMTVDNLNTIASLTFSGAAAALNASSGVLTLSSGQVVVQNPVGASDRSIVGGTLMFGVGGTGAAATFSTQRDTTVSSSLVGDAGLVKNGPAKLTLSGSLAGLSGPLAVNHGTISFVNSAGFTNLTGAGTIEIGAAAILTLNATVNQSVAATLTGAGGVNFNPASVLTATLMSANSHAGGTTSGANGRLSLRNASALGTGPVTLQATTSSTFSVPLVGFDFGIGAATTVANDMTLPTTGVINNVLAIANSNVNTGQTVTLAGRLSGGASNSFVIFDENGVSQSHTFRLTNPNNDFQGTIRVVSGGLAITSNGALGNANNGLQLNSAAPTQGTLRFDAAGITLPATRAIAIGGSVTINTNGFDATIAGPLSGSLSVDKTGPGTLTLTNAAQPYTGAMFVRAGTLAVDGVIASSTNLVTVTAGATLAGNGTINRPVVVNQDGIVSPGSSPGILTIGGGITLGGTLSIEAGDQLNVLGSYANTGTSGVAFQGAFNPITQYDFLIFTSFNGVPFVNVLNQPVTHFLVYSPGMVSLVPVPEPAFILLACAGAAGLVRWRRKRAT